MLELFDGNTRCLFCLRAAFVFSSFVDKLVDSSISLARNRPKAASPMALKCTEALSMLPNKTRCLLDDVSWIRGSSRLVFRVIYYVLSASVSRCLSRAFE